MRFVRLLLAILSLAAMTLALVVPSAGFAARLGWLPRAQLLPAVLAGEAVALAAIAVSVVLCGRLYCALACPLGISQDLSRLLFRALRLARNGAGVSRAWRAVRLAVLALFAAAVFFGYAWTLAPYGIFARFVTVGAMRFGDPSAAAVAFAAGLFAFILAMTAFAARWWCNRVCPVGTLLGLFSRFSLFRARVDAAKCVGCGKCAKRCAAGALYAGPDRKVRVDSASCVACFDCVGSCKTGALAWKPRAR